MAAKKTHRTPRSSATKTIMLMGLPLMEVAIGPAFDRESASRVSGHFHCPDHHVRVGQAWQCPGTNSESVPGKPHLVDRSNLDQAYEADNGAVVVLTSDEKDRLAAESDSAVTIEAWVEEMSPAYFDGQPNAIWWVSDASLTSVSMWTDVLREKGGALIGKTSDHGRTKGVAIRYEPEFGCLAYHTLKYGDQLRRENLRMIQDGLAANETPAEAMTLADTLLGSLATSFDVMELADEAGERMLAAINEKAKSGAVTTAAPTPVEPVDLLASLRATVDAVASSKPKAKKKPKAKQAA